MSNNPILFGTDGWRAVVGEDFTIENVRRVATATGRWVLETYGDNVRVVVGYDPRTLGSEAARATASVLAGQGIRVYLADEITPTPAISWATKEYGCSAGVVITASHNPAEYNGFKIKGHFGGSALPDMIGEIERHLADVPASVSEKQPFDTFLADGLVQIRSVRAEYLGMIRNRFDISAIREAGIRIVHDAMYGAGQGAFSELLGQDNVCELHSHLDSSFGGTPPEPIERNLSELPKMVRDLTFSAGIANDGDADRIGMTDENGEFVDSHKMLALLVQYLHEDLGLSGQVVKTFSTSDIIDIMCRFYGLPVRTTPIGFKYIVGFFLDEDVLVGGEESGGIAVKGHVPERDGIYIGMLILEMMAHRGKTLSQLVADLHERFGPHAYHRVDVHTSQSAKEKALAILKASGGLTEIAGEMVLEVESLDGHKHRLGNGWLLIRPSGTEPVLRIYSESETAEQAKSNVDDAVDQLGI